MISQQRVCMPIREKTVSMKTIFSNKSTPRTHDKIHTFLHGKNSMCFFFLFILLFQTILSVQVSGL